MRAENVKVLNKRVRPCACVLDRRAAMPVSWTDAQQRAEEGDRGQRAEAWMKTTKATGKKRHLIRVRVALCIDTDDVGDVEALKRLGVLSPPEVGQVELLGVCRESEESPGRHRSWEDGIASGRLD